MCLIELSSALNNTEAKVLLKIYHNLEKVLKRTPVVLL